MTQEEAFVQFLENYKPLIIKVASSYFSVSIERNDLIQDIILQLWKSFHKYDSSFESSTWVYKVALNVSISNLRKSTKRANIIKEYRADHELIHWQDYAVDEKLTQLHKALDKLDPFDKAVMILKLEGKAEQEAADILGISKTNYATKVSRIKSKLKTQLKQ